jgi:glycosyltransferase involved in cell wall biosynthesis
MKKAIGRKPVAVLPNPVVVRDNGDDPPAHPWYEERAMAGGDRFSLLCAVGNVIPRKGHDILVRTLALLPDARLVCVGRFDDLAYLDDLKRLASELGVEGRLSFTGYQPDPAPYMRYADVFLNASRSESFCMVLIEAMASGVPVVATDCPVGPSDVLEGGSAGLLVPCDDPAAMAKAITQLCSDNALRAKLIDAGLRRAKRFSIQQAADRYVDVVPLPQSHRYVSLNRKLAAAFAHNSSS